MGLADLQRIDGQGAAIPATGCGTTSPVKVQFGAMGGVKPDTATAGADAGVDYWARLRSTAEAADFLGLSKRSVEMACKRDTRARGSIPHIVLPMGGKRKVRRFTFSMLTAWTADGCLPAEDFLKSWKKHH